MWRADGTQEHVLSHWFQWGHSSTGIAVVGYCGKMLPSITSSHGSRSKPNQPVQKPIVLNPHLGASACGQTFKSCRSTKLEGDMKQYLTSDGSMWNASGISESLSVNRSFARCSSFRQWKGILNLGWKHWIAGKNKDIPTAAPDLASAFM